jgi:hypothetical protein
MPSPRTPKDGTRHRRVLHKDLDQLHKKLDDMFLDDLFLDDLIMMKDSSGAASDETKQITQKEENDELFPILGAFIHNMSGEACCLYNGMHNTIKE